MQDCTIGIDLGGTKIAFGIVDDQGNLLQQLRCNTETQGGFSEVIRQIADGVSQLKGQSTSPPLGIGIGVAGQVCPVSGTVIFAPNLYWHEAPLRAEIEKACEIPVTVTNDVRAALWGEWLFGAGRGAVDLICVFVGTGIGGGIVSGGKLLEGCSNTAGEIGHMTVDLRGPICTCGNRGCMEALAGGWAMTRNAHESIRRNPDLGGTLLKMAGGKIENVTVKTLAQAYYVKDPLAAEIIDEAFDALGAGIASLVNSINPCQIILGGGIIEGMPEMVPRIENQVRSRALAAATSRLTIRTAELGSEAGIIGAAALAMQRGR